MHVFSRAGMSWAALMTLALFLEVSAHAAGDAVSLDVVVTDARARPLRDLRPADLDLTDSGEACPIDAVRTPPEGARVFGIFLDEFHVAAGESTDRARAALLHFVDTQLRDGDEVAVVKPLDPLHAISFTRDRTVVRQVIAAFAGHAGDYTARTEFEHNFLSRDPKTAEPARAQVVGAALQALSRKLGDQQDGLKALIFVSEGFRPPQPRAIVYAANRNRVAIYAVDPSIAAGDSDAMLGALAEQTGGMASVNTADMTPVLKQAASDLDNHVVISFKRPGVEDGRFHPVQVRVKRPGALARVRSGYWAPDAALAAAAARAAAPRTTLPFRPSRSSPFIRPWIGMTRGDAGLTRVTIAWEPGEDPPRNQRVGAVTLKAMSGDGTVVFEHRLGPGDADRAAFDVAPGMIAIEMAIQTTSGAPLDTDYRAVTVPNLEVSKPTFATPQVLRTRTARQFSEVSHDPDAIPSPSRTFSRTERLLIRVPAYAAGNTTPVVTARLLNRGGAVMRDLPSVPGPLAPGIVQFDLALASLAPDEYSIELSAANAGEPRDEVKETLIFEVTN